MKTFSFVVVGHNAGERLESCLESVKDAFLPSGWCREILYVDLGSSDNSRLVAGRAGASVLCSGDNGVNTMAAARNSGLQAASGEWVMMLDADVEINQAFVLRASGQMNPHTAAIVGRCREKHPDATICNRLFDLDSEQPASMWNGGGAILRRAAVRDCGGYEPSLVAGEKPDLYARLLLDGWDVEVVADCVTWHDLTMTRLSQYVNPAIQGGYACAELVRRWPEGLRQRWGVAPRQNMGQPALVLAVFMLAMATPICGWAGMSSMLVISAAVARSMWINRRRCPDLSILFCYALHRHVQQVPMLWGWGLYYWRKRYLHL